MGKGKQNVLVVSNQNPLIYKLKTNYKELETHFKNWLVNHSLENVAESAIKAVVRATLFFFVGPRNEWKAALESKVPMLPIILGGGRLVRARNMAVMSGVYTGIWRVMERLRGKENVETVMAAGFGAGFVVSLDKFSHRQKHVKDVCGLDHSEKNVENSFLKDESLPLLSDREEVKKGGTGK